MTSPRPRRPTLALLPAVLGAVLALATAPALAASPPALTLFAGTGSTGTAVPGPAATSPVGQIDGMGVDAAGNVYITNGSRCTIDKITPAGTLSVIAGSGGCGQPVAGPALATQLWYDYGLAVDPAGNVYALDYHEIVRIAADGTLSIIAGNGSNGSPVAGPALASPLTTSYWIAAGASGTVYLQDTNNLTIWKLAGGTLSHFAGNGSYGSPVAGLALSSPLGTLEGTGAVGADDTLYVADFTGHAYSISPGGVLSVIAGNGSAATPVPGPATASPMGMLGSIAIDPSGNVLIADWSQNRVLKVTPGGTLSIYAGNGATGAPTAGPPTASATDSAWYVATDSAGTGYVSTGARVLRIAPPEPSAPRAFVVTRNGGTAALSFDPPLNPGLSAITGYEVSTDGGVTWSALATAASSGTTRTATVSGLTQATTAVLVRAVNASGGGVTTSGAALPPVLPADPAAPVLAAPEPASPAAPQITTTIVTTTPFVVAVRFRLPGTCAGGCTITKATLALRDGATLGVRRNLRVAHAGYVRFTVTIDKQALLDAGADILKPGWRTTQTRFTVAVRSTGGAPWSRVKNGRIAVSLGRLQSGRLPDFPALL